MFTWRSEAVERLRRETFDVVVMGGGITGARVALEAARHALHVALIEGGDFGGGTSSASSKLVHGGFRYLAMGDVGLVRESQHERRVLIERVAPNLVRPLPFLLPVYQGSSRGPAAVSTGLVLYHALSGRGGRVGWAGPQATARLVPPLRRDGLRMCGVFEEAETIDSRLVLATVKGAAKLGALVLNHARVIGLDLRHNRGGAVTVDMERDGIVDVRARHVVNATGPWVDQVRRIDAPCAEPIVRLSKGVHLLLPLEHEWRAGVAAPLDGGRVALGIPWQGMLMLGTTDTLFTGDPVDAGVTASDVACILEEASRFLPPEMLVPERVRFQTAGLRALPITGGDTAAARRGHMIEVSGSGMVSVAGGKLTTHRLIACDALRRLGIPDLERVTPDDRRLPGTGWSPHVEARTGLDPEVADHLERLYGDETGRVLEMAAGTPDGLERIHPDGPDVWAQAAYAVDSEWARDAEDVVRRRTTLSVRGLATAALTERIEALASRRPNQTGIPS